MKRETYKEGDILCDMHDGFKGLPDNLEVVSSILLRTDKATEVLYNITDGAIPGNKYLVIVGHSPDYSYLVAAYSYDGRVFGMVQLQEKACPPVAVDSSSSTQ